MYSADRCEAETAREYAWIAVSNLRVSTRVIAENCSDMEDES